MSEYRDDFIDSLNYQVKAEAVGRYLRERLILDEEVNEYQEVLARYRVLEGETRQIRDDLACLLVTPQNFKAFFVALGFSRPPLARLGHADILRGPSCPVGLSPRGFTKKGRYVNVVMQTYALLYEKARAGGEAAENIFSLASEINRDIKRFHQNFDLMSILTFLKSMDLEMLVKQKFMGGNFTAAEINSIEHEMTFKKISARNDGLRAWPELPAPAEAERLTSDLLTRIFKEERESILRGMK